MARQFTSVLYCAVFIQLLAILAFLTSATEWQDGRSLKSQVEGNNEVDQRKLDISVKKVAYNSSKIPMKTKSRNKRLAFTLPIFLETIGFVASILSVIDFVSNKIPGKADSIPDKLDEIQDHFKTIERQLNEQKKRSEAVLKAIKKLSLTSGYSESESIITFSLKKLQKYLRHPTDEHLRKDFFDHATMLPIHLNNLFEGLLGKKIFNADIMTTLRDINNCHGRKLREEIEPILSFIKAGFAVYITYLRQTNVSTIARSSYQNETIILSTNVSTRLDEMVLKCRTDESKVKEDMRSIIIEHPLGLDPPVASTEKLNKELANKLLSFLEDKYNMKKWFVFVINSNQNVLLSSGFHQVKVQNTIAAIASNNPADAFSSIAPIFLQDFKIPYKTEDRGFSYQLRRSNDLKKIKRYLDYYLMMMRTKIDTETIIINQQYSTSEYPVVSSSAPYTVFNSTVKNGFKTNLDWQVIVVAVKPSAPFNSSLSAALDSLTQNQQNQCRWIPRTKQSHPLGNIVNDLYLTVEGDSMEDGAYIIMGEWKNSSNQRWRFVNNQLRNDNGKCLTAWTLENSYLYQYKCHPDWTGQKWYQHGPQIINGYEMCLSQRIYTPYVFQGKCGIGLDDPTWYPFMPTYSYLDRWQNFHNDCFGKLITSARLNYEGYGHLRPEKWKVYLTEHKYEDKLYVKLHPWNNEPSQYWKLDDGKLINGNGNCLILDDNSWFTDVVNCNQVKSGHRLTYNHKKQIVNDKGYCLSFPLGLDDSLYVNRLFSTFIRRYKYARCREEDQQRWIFEF